MNPHDLREWDEARSRPFTRDELRVVMERAHDLASNEAIRKASSTWELRAAMWSALAQAALACDALMARDELSSMWGTPEQEKPK